MSEDFDKEAEREKLRKRFEQDKREREATQRMSDLLLKGATMTNKHCNECGDPIFRQNGQEFCPTCQREVEGSEGANSDAAGEERTGEKRPQDTEPTGQESRPQQDAGQDRQNRQPSQVDQQDSGQRAQQPPRTERQDDSTLAQNAGEHDAPTDKPASPPSEASGHGTDQDTHRGASETRSHPRMNAGGATNSNPDHGRPPEHGDDSPQPPTARHAGAGGLDAARAQLAEAIRTHATRSTAVDDPTTATEHLEAAREAAEALAVLDRSA